MQDNYNHMFDEHWSLYQKILKHNYMGHNQIFTVMQNHLVEQRKAKIGSLLDLGCGDAQTLCRYLQAISVNEFIGVDLSPDALSHAEGFIRTITDNYRLIESDFQHAIVDLASEKTSFDVIFSGFALHHLNASEKATMFKKIQQQLNESGWFYYIDVVKEEHESRNDYLDKYLFKPQTQWHHLTKTEFEILDHHVRSSDYPATQEEIACFARDAGFSYFECLLYDREHSNILMACRK